jgi:ribulose-phosphate 3-epimerase
MNADICPAITAHTPDEYRTQLSRIAAVAKRVHLDVSDGKLTPEKLLDIADLWWPATIRADIHVMYKRPFDHAALLVNLQPQLIIVHAEAQGDFISFAQKAHKHGVEVGVALQQDTSPEVIKPALPFIDHVLIFSGNLGYFGGTADLQLLTKVSQLLQWKPQLEIGWDGGVNPENARALVEGGVQVLNSGGFIQGAKNQAEAYEQLVLAAKSAKV